MRFTWPNTAIELLVILLLALLVRGLLRRVIARVVRQATRRAEGQSGGRAAALAGQATRLLLQAADLNSKRQAHRTRTLGSMLGSLVDVLVGLVTVFMMLQTLGVNVMPAVASAGIGGVALGFGAQSLVKDVISGIFLMLEDQLGVGDQIDIGTLTGTVQAMGLRVTRVQDTSGEIWYIRNGEIVTLGNRTQGWSTGSITLPVATTADPFKVIAVLTEVCAAFANDPQWQDQILSTPEALGLSGVEVARANYLIVVKCPANQQWGVERELRARALAALTTAGIEIAQLPLPERSTD